MKYLFTILSFAAALAFVNPTTVRAQVDTRVDTRVSAQQSKTATPTPSKTTAAQQPTGASADRLEPDDTSTLRPELSPEMVAGRREMMSEVESAILPYYNNFLKTYRLGPEDVISVEVFDQPRYSKAGITIPPTGKISYMHIKGGISVVGKTTEEVQEEIRRQYEEYIIDPVVTVTLDKAASARYSIIGDVAQPGVRVITRRSSVAEAIAEAGGVLPTGDKGKVALLRRRADGTMQVIPVNLKKILQGKAPDNVFVGAGDQIVVPGNRLKTLRQITELFSVVSFARIFTGGF